MPARLPQQILLFAITFLGFGMQILVLRFFYLFFYDASRINILALSFFGLSAGLFLRLFAGNRIFPGLGLATGCLVLFAYSLSCFFVIDQSLAQIFVLFFYVNLGVAIGESALALKAFDFYFFDILGAAAGSLAGFFLPHFFSAEAAFVFMLSAGVSAAAYTGFSRGLARTLLFGLAAALSSVFFVLAYSPDLDLSKYGAPYRNPFEKNDPEINAQKKIRRSGAARIFSGWSSVGKVETVETRGPRPHLLFYSSNRIWYSFPKMNAPVPDAASNGQTALVIGSGGGLEVRLLLSLGYAVTALELNEMTYALMKEKFYGESGGFASRVRYLNQEGRNFLETNPEKFDLIFITNIGTNGGPAGAGDDLSANTLFTAEAFESYYRHLNPGGFVVSTNNYSDSLRVQSGLLRELETSRRVLGGSGENPEDNIWIFGQPRKFDVQDHRKLKSLVFHRKGAVNEGEADLVYKIKSLMSDGAHVIHVPPAFAESRAENLSPVEETARAILGASQAARVKKDFGQDIFPVTDANPYFYSSAPDFWANTKALLVISALILVLAGLRRPSRFFRDRLAIGAAQDYGLIVMSVVIGLAGALLEISLINSLALFFPSVVVSFSLVTVAFLTGSSAAAAGVRWCPGWPVRASLAAAAGIAIATQYLVVKKTAIFAISSSALRLGIVASVVLFLAFFSSIMMAKLIVEAKSRAPNFILSLLAFNFAAWGAGSELARALNFNLGHHVTLGVAAVILLLLAWLAGGRTIFSK